MRLLICAMFFCSSLFADISQFQTITATPVNPNGVAIRSGGFPPTPGVELSVFNPLSNLLLPPDQLPEPPYNTEYEVIYNVSEKPAAVVAIPAEMVSYDYQEGVTGDISFPNRLTIKVKHVPYAGGVAADLPGPVSDFAIAILPAAQSIPASLTGSWMATNISPYSWTIIPPSAENPAFGYELNGPEGSRAFFDMFIPNSFIAFLSSVIGQPVTIADLALFNNGSQVSSNVVASGDGALVNISLTFSSISDEVIDEDVAFARASTSKEKLTVANAKKLSLAANAKQIRRGKKVKLFGWVKNILPGKKVSIFKVGSKTAIKKVSPNSSGYFQYSPKLTSTTSFTSSYSNVKSNKVKVVVR